MVKLNRRNRPVIKVKCYVANEAAREALEKWLLKVILSVLTDDMFDFKIKVDMVLASQED